jgi:hypothetical protein
MKGRIFMKFVIMKLKQKNTFLANIPHPTFANAKATLSRKRERDDQALLFVQVKKLGQ